MVMEGALLVGAKVLAMLVMEGAMLAMLVMEKV